MIFKDKRLVMWKNSSYWMDHCIHFIYFEQI